MKIDLVKNTPIQGDVFFTIEIGGRNAFGNRMFPNEEDAKKQYDAVLEHERRMKEIIESTEVDNGR